jgi:pimeloyl-ACP methyl ester carboxylesterase
MLAGAVMVGCAPFQIYRPLLDTCGAPDELSLNVQCSQHAVEVLQPILPAKPGYALGFIEFDDQGQLWSPPQMAAVLGAVNTETGDGDRDFLLVAFVHGWKHDAGPKDSNVANFRLALAQLSAAETALSQKVGRPPRKVVGVYLGWRGESITAPLAEDLTFWDRKNTAHKVGHGQVTEVLERLEQLRQQRLERNPASRSRLIVVGHSFGGAVVFSALEQILEARFFEPPRSPAAPGVIEGFGNLVVLINPAFEAQLYEPLSDLSTERASYAKSQLPVLAILTSEADKATGVAFPIGRWFSTRFEKQRKVDRFNPIIEQLHPGAGSTETIYQKDTDIDAVGHYETYRTHLLRAVQPAASATATVDVPQLDTKALALASQEWEDDRPGSEIAFPGTVLTRTERSAGRNPYLVINVDKKLIADHDDIWRPGIRDFITHLILISSQSNDLQERASHREAAAN